MVSAVVDVQQRLIFFWGGGGDQKSVAAMATTAATLPTPLYCQGVHALSSDYMLQNCAEIS